MAGKFGEQRIICINVTEATNYVEVMRNYYRIYRRVM